MQQGPTSQAAPADLQESPLMQNPDFLTLLRTAWRDVLQNPDYCKQLSTYCVFCRQWISLVGPGCKQHHRLMHAAEYRLASDATARVVSLGLVPETPCRYCHKLIKDPRKHLQACVPVYQASLAALVIQQRDCEDQDGRGRRGDASLLCEGGAGYGVRQGKAGEPWGDGGAGGGSPAQVEEDGGRQRTLSGWLVGQQQASVGALEAQLCGGEAGPPDAALGHHVDQSCPSTRGGPDHVPGGYQLCGIRRYFAPLVPPTDQGCRSRLAGTVQQGGGEKATEAVPHAGDLQDSQRGYGSSDHRRREASALQSGGMAGRRPERTGPCLVFPCLGSSAEKGGSIGDGYASLPRGDPSRPGRPDEPPPSGRSSPPFQEHQRPQPADGRGSHTVPGHDQSPIPDGTGNASHPVQAGGLRLLQAFGLSHQARKGAEIPDEQTSGAGLQGRGFLRVEPAGPRLVQGVGLGRQAPAEAVPREARPLQYRPGLALPLAKLANPRGANLCYANATFQAWYWQHELSGSAWRLPRTIQAGRKALGTQEQIDVTQRMAFHRVFVNWPHLRKQHDAGEFWQHLHAALHTAVMAGEWQARLCNPYTIQDRGSLRGPILLRPLRDSLQQMVQEWQDQYAVHGLWTCPDQLCLQLCRYQDHRHKDRTTVMLEPGESVHLPCFCTAEDSTAVQHVTYQVSFVVFHIGEQPSCGHYQAARSMPQPRTDPVGWLFMICNDKKSPRPATTRDLKLLRENAYLVGLVRS